MKRPKLVVGSGWWSTSGPNPWAIGDPATRTPEFFKLWLHLIEKYVKPSRIVVIDSNAPKKPCPELRAKVAWLELDRNYGHANDLRTGRVSGKYCGVTRALIMGAAFALCNDADLFCYVEQGCLVHGEDVIGRALSGREPGIMIGEPTQGGRGLNGGPAAPMPQMSLVIVGRMSLQRFINGLMAGPESDGELSPELKLVRDCAPIEHLAIPFGRSRPIDFTIAHFYLKHATKDELLAFLALEDLDPREFGLSLSRG